MPQTPRPAPPNTLYYGDNLDVLRQHVADESVDLIYLDPPFNSNADYNAFFTEQDGTRAAAQLKAFGDTWRWDQGSARAFDEFVSDSAAPDRAKSAMLGCEKLVGHTDLLAYLAMMAPRLAELRRVLKPTGSLYLHCDPTASHYLKLVMDGIFGPRQFRNEVIWKRTSAHSTARRCGPVHDTLLFYTRSGQYTWNPQYDRQTTDRRGRHDLMSDGSGRLMRSSDLTGAGRRNGRSGLPWRGFDPNATGRHWMTTVDKLDALDRDGRVYFPPDGKLPRLLKPHADSPGRAIGDVWDGIPPINAKAAERLGYPTQKPVALLERIIAASSHPGDLVLDPFCGCGTTVAAAHKLGRRWTGIDITALATALIKKRLRGEYGPTVEAAYRVVGEPTTVEDAARLAADDPYQFQCWALGLVDARPLELKKGADRGVDGRRYITGGGTTHQVIFSVKAGANISVRDVRDLIGTVDLQQAAVGVLLTMHPPTKPMRQEAATAAFFKPIYDQTFPRIQILTVGELLAGKRLDLPTWADTTTFKQARRVKAAPGRTPSLPIPGDAD